MGPVIHRIPSRGEKLTIIVLSVEGDDFGLYGTRNNAFGTPLVARGTINEILDFRNEVRYG